MPESSRCDVAYYVPEDNGWKLVQGGSFGRDNMDPYAELLLRDHRAVILVYGRHWTGVTDGPLPPLLTVKV